MFDNSFWSAGASTPWGNVQVGTAPTPYYGPYGGYPYPGYPAPYPVPNSYGAGSFALDGWTILIIGVIVVLLIAK